MAYYTIELSTLIRNGFDIGLKDYPIYDENHRDELNTKLINHYMFREIGQETATLFKFYLNRAMSEIMPYYNEMYKSALLEFDPLNGYNFTETEEMSSNANSEGESTGTNRAIFSETPQTEITFEEIEKNKYATNANLDETKAGTKSQTKGNSKRTKTSKGNQYHNQSELLQAYRETILNIDMMVIEDKAIQNCFMQIY